MTTLENPTDTALLDLTSWWKVERDGIALTCDAEAPSHSVDMSDALRPLLRAAALPSKVSFNAYLHADYSFRILGTDAAAFYVDSTTGERQKAHKYTPIQWRDKSWQSQLEIAKIAGTAFLMFALFFLFIERIKRLYE